MSAKMLFGIALDLKALRANAIPWLSQSCRRFTHCLEFTNATQKLPEFRTLAIGMVDRA
jgi:hypothetical protein